MVNHLAGETSPYLLQHADNPVDWYPWGPTALAKARGEDKPIFLSIGYSACHWCHVMERESFEDEQTAAFLNQRFVSIKVDREERPDLDAVYMEAVQALTGQGGWPLNVWLTPDGAPFFGGTYFPPTPGRGMPSFPQVLEAISKAWDTRRSELLRSAETVWDRLDTQESRDGLPGAPERSRILNQAAESLARNVDHKHGGWGAAPKFPHPMVLDFLLAMLSLRERADLRSAVEVTLDAMAAGGIYDHLGGGFHRYSTDGSWLVPHFEKMLYDNAQLARCYLHAWLLLGKPRYRAVVVETLDYLLREMRHPEGGFYSTQDADTEQGEGAYFTWTRQEVGETLSPDQKELFEQSYGLTTKGNFEGRNILHLPLSGGTPNGEAEERLAAARVELLRVRSTRPRPARDEKIIAGWNGLALRAFAEAAAALESPVYRQAAEQAGQFALARLGAESAAGGALGTPPRTRLAHSWKDGRISGDAFLDDYACLADGLLALYECTLDERWFGAARGLTDEVIERFRRRNGGFYDTSADHETLFIRPRSTYDGATPSGNSMAATVLLKMQAYTGERKYGGPAQEALDSLADTAAASPVMSGQWLSAALLAETGITEVAVVGDLSSAEGRALLDAVRARFHPLAVFAAGNAGAASQIPLLFGREPGTDIPAAAWVCRHSTCLPPTGDPGELARLLTG
jgi:uncharacterized protein YyaL (SSP411 family)